MIEYFEKKTSMRSNYPASQRSDVSPTSHLTNVITTDRDDDVEALLYISSNQLVRASSLEGENNEEVTDQLRAKEENQKESQMKKNRMQWSKKMSMNDAALKMKRLKKEAAAAGKRVPRNAYTQILTDILES